jgi:hypothetical protein
MERWQTGELANPVASVNQGRISALRRGPDGKLRMIQTDAAVNPGNSGGPMIDQHGVVLGVVTAKVGTDGIGFGVSSDRVREFITGHGYKVEFQPQVIVDDTKRLVVRLESSLIDLQTMDGEFSVSGGKTPDTSVPFVWNGRTLEACVELGQTSSSDAAEGMLRGSIGLTDQSGREVTRVFRLRGTTSRATGSRARPSGLVSESPASAELGMPAQNRPSALGGGVFAEAKASPRQSSNGVMISDELMAEIQKYKFSPEQYEALPFEGRRSLAEQYDRLLYDLYRKVVRFQQRDRRDYSTASQLRREIEDLLGQLTSLQSKIREFDMCRCGWKWKQCDDESCHDKEERPWVDDDFGELRRALKYD